MSQKTPVLLIAFNRPEQTLKVFNEIKKYQPEKLFIAVDGPRNYNLEDSKKIQQVKEVIGLINWECDVETLFREKNLGCKLAVSSAINWFFENIEEGIILEDDCLPDQSFFKFCKEMLDKYKNEEKIMHINGSNFQFKNKRENSSYYFSHYPHVWGWATWKRAWNKYDIEMYNLSDFIKSKKTYKLLGHHIAAKFWNSLFKHVKEKRVDTWDAQWTYSIMNNEGLVITPNINLVKNIGFGDNATHTKQKDFKLSTESDTLSELKHTDRISLDKEADDYTFKVLYKVNMLERIFLKIKNIWTK